MLLDLLAAWFFLRFRERPGHFFGVAGLITGGLGGARAHLSFHFKACRLGYRRPSSTDHWSVTRARRASITTGLIAEMLTRLRSRSQPPLTKQTDATGWSQGSNDRPA